MKKVLIITYYWPPAGGPGVQRWLKFVKYLREYAIDPVVFVPENPTYPIKDTSLSTEIPEDITVLKRSIFEPYRFAQFFSKKDTNTISKGIIARGEKQSFIQRLLLYIRGNYFIPDARKFWVKPSVRFLKKYLKKHQIDTIITTGPPHSVHLIGLELKKEMGSKWVADFRDPWTTIGYHDKLKLGKRAKEKHTSLEEEVLTNADHVLVTSNTTKHEFEAITLQPITVITNGYDYEKGVEVSLSDRFTISHIGSLLSGRNPVMLWKALYDLTEEHPDFATSLEIQLVGAVSEDVLESIKGAGLTSFLTLKGYVSHQEAVAIQRSSQLLVLIEIDVPETRCIIPGKLFEYMVSNRPILAIGPEGADIEGLIKETNTGVFYQYRDYTDIKKQLWEYYQQFLKGTLQTQPIGLQRFSRKELTRTLSEVLKKL
ncbi:glycosyltransferase family 4 protein [Aquimarina sp. TRL1]|uniref:glycosyltransferase family 4 protein n=1 Tax=Aquimarina sp. (strain TRL1) TaxID=2736252 RepID=UPI001588EF9F|nr:glycosyltransferase family 4 protein [Aquimarina sp. TRL1]QKX06365.1 glycosyltransferase family 4 protein [Aquimarina sp. TRL1]